MCLAEIDVGTDRDDDRLAPDIIGGVVLGADGESVLVRIRVRGGNGGQIVCFSVADGTERLVSYILFRFHKISAKMRLLSMVLLLLYRHAREKSSRFSPKKELFGKFPPKVENRPSKLCIYPPAGRILPRNFASSFFPGIMK